MRYIGRWRGKIENEGQLDEEERIDIYVFDNPELIKHNEYNPNIIRVHPKNNDYRHWQIINDVLQKKPKQGILQGIGFDKNCLFRINKRTNLDRLSKEIGIKRVQLESILSGC